MQNINNFMILPPNIWEVSPKYAKLITKFLKIITKKQIFGGNFQILEMKSEVAVKKSKNYGKYPECLKI